MSDQQVLSETAHGIATITLNRPAALNALTPQMMEGLIDATARAERASSSSLSGISVKRAAGGMTLHGSTGSLNLPMPTGSSSVSKKH